MSSLHQKISH